MTQHKTDYELFKKELTIYDISIIFVYIDKGDKMKTDKIKQQYENYEDEVIKQLDKLCDELGPVAVIKEFNVPIHEKQMRNYSKKRQQMKPEKLFGTGKALKV